MCPGDAFGVGGAAGTDVVDDALVGAHHLSASATDGYSPRRDRASAHASSCADQSATRLRTT